MKLSYLCIMFFLYLSNIITAQEKDTITVLLIGDSTTKGATPRRVKPNGIHLEETIEQLSALEPFMPTVRVINSSRWWRNRPGCSGKRKVQKGNISIKGKKN